MEKLRKLRTAAIQHRTFLNSYCGTLGEEEAAKEPPAMTYEDFV